MAAREVRGRLGLRSLMGPLPYRTSDDPFDGVVMLFLDISRVPPRINSRRARNACE
ncbi:MAG: hypothetical protein AB7Q29_11340 [Vicinamibacterales bacterium]